MSDPVPAIAEASATGAVAEIFADICTVLGVEVVNLIWRHLATIPDALPWAWGMLRHVAAIQNRFLFGLLPKVLS